MKVHVKVEATANQMSTPPGLYVRVETEGIYQSAWLDNTDYSGAARISDALEWALDTLQETHDVKGMFVYDRDKDEFVIEATPKEKSVDLNDLMAALEGIGISEDLTGYTSIEIELANKPRVVLRGFTEAVVYNVEK